ncbi:MAG TPA: hypothetical protein VMD92_17715 [Acidobacteriaceae bacterium]|nr:hypothetical protein [Acidobacteriaceae bacterium]
MEDSLLSILDAKVIVFPSKASPSLDVPRFAFSGADEGKFRGGSLRGLFWALLLEGAVIALAIGGLMAWHTMHLQSGRRMRAAASLTAR